MATPPPPYTIRPFLPSSTDMSSITNISALGNAHDELANYMRRHITSQWTSYRASCGRWLKSKLAAKGTVCYVAESTGTGEVVGWALWSRHGKREKAEEWKRGNAGWRMGLERSLLGLGKRYFERMPGVDRTAERGHVRELMPILGEEWPKEIFEEFWELDGLYVDPREYRRGIGRMLVMWGVERGMEEGVPVVVRSSPQGKRLYLSCGFEVVKREVGFDAYIPEFEEDLKVMAPEEARGCWALCWQPEGTDYLERARRWVEEEREEGVSGKKGMEVGTAAEAIAIT